MKGPLCVSAWIWLLAGSTAASAVEVPELRQLAVQGRFQEALTAVDEALTAEPASPELQFMRGFILARAGREDEALQVFLELTRRHPEHPEPFNNLAVIYARRGDYERAVDILKRALQTHSSYRTAYENLTKVYGQLASRAYDRALGQDSDAPNVGPALHLLSDLDAEVTSGEPDGDRVVVLEPLAAPAAEPEEEAVAPTPAPAPVASAPTAPAPETIFDASELVDLVESWARAWSEQRSADYLGFYADAFSPADGTPRSRWAAQRRERIARPRFIEVGVDSIGVRPLPGGRAQVKFVQSYRSDSYRDRVTKTLDMVREGEEWKIVRETSRPE